jgi:hypothetical protein
MKHKAAMATNECPSWETAVKDEHQRMVDSGAWKAVPCAELPCKAKFISCLIQLFPTHSEASEC